MTNYKKRFLFFLGVIIFFFAAGLSAAPEDFDIIIKNGQIIDGRGNPRYLGDIGIKKDTIRKIGNLENKTALKIIDAKTMVVAPGFIDIHTHCDRGLGKPGTTFNANFLTQGVTTVVTGNCGSAPFKISETKAEWEKSGIGTNAIILAGLGTIRNEILGVENRAPRIGELKRMEILLRQAMKEGAWGLSLALQYIPDRFATTEEVIAMAKVAGEFGGVCISHQRSEEAELIQAVKETIRISEETKVPFSASHLKASGKSNWGLMKEAVRLIDEARGKGIPIASDVYTYGLCVSSPLVLVFSVPDDLEDFSDLLPALDHHYILKRVQEPHGISRIGANARVMDRQELLAKYTDKLEAALKDTIKRERIEKLTLQGAPNKLNWVSMFGWDSFTVLKSKKNLHFIGKTIADIATEQIREPFDVASELFLEEKSDLVISVFTMSEEDIGLALKQKWMMISSDSGTLPLKAEQDVPPGSYGTFTRILRKYVREEKLMTLEEAVRKMTFLPAQFLGLRDRGLLAEGSKADIIVFDPETVSDSESGFDAQRKSLGIAYVIINGKIGLDEGQFNNAFGGRVLLHATGNNLF